MKELRFTDMVLFVNSLNYLSKFMDNINLVINNSKMEVYATDIHDFCFTNFRFPLNKGLGKSEIINNDILEHYILDVEKIDKVLTQIKRSDQIKIYYDENKILFELFFNKSKLKSKFSINWSKVVTNTILDIATKDYILKAELDSLTFTEIIKQTASVSDRISFSINQNGFLEVKAQKDKVEVIIEVPIYIGEYKNGATSEGKLEKTELNSIGSLETTSIYLQKMLPLISKSEKVIVQLSPEQPLKFSLIKNDIILDFYFSPAKQKNPLKKKANSHNKQSLPIIQNFDAFIQFLLEIYSMPNFQQEIQVLNAMGLDTKGQDHLRFATSILDLAKYSRGKVTLTEQGIALCETLVNNYDDGKDLLEEIIKNKVELYEEIMNILKNSPPITLDEITFLINSQRKSKNKPKISKIDVSTILSLLDWRGILRVSGAGYSITLR